MRTNLLASLPLALAVALVPATVAGTADDPAPAPAAGTGPVLVNQIGYAAGADKIATVVTAATRPLTWQLLDDRGRTVASGTTRVVGPDKASGDHVHQADFSHATGQGVRRLTVAGTGTSVPFTVSRAPLHPQLGREALRYFYFHRMGTPVEARYLQYAAHAHPALHPGDSSVPCWKNWCGKETGGDGGAGRERRLDVAGSWADAGDFGVYPVNHAVSAWTLLNLYERRKHVYGDGSLPLPEAGNGVPDILDEVAYGSRFMSGMLPASGLASHKVHNHTWSPFPVTDIAAENALPRSAMPPSTNATYAVARTNAQLARVLERFDAGRARALWASARDAWARAEARPDVDQPESDDGTDAEGGGDYPDARNSDDRYAAAAELYLTARQRADRSAAGYRAAVTGSPHYGEIGPVDWSRAAPAGTLSLLAVPGDLPEADLARMRADLRTAADALVDTQRREGYPALISGAEPYPWGSNAAVVNRMLLLGTAYDLGHDRRHLKAMHRAMDYLLGTNAMRISYVTGYGAHRETDLHDRLAWGRYPATPYPHGWLSGGPNSVNINDPVTPPGRPAAKSYAGPGTAPSAWGSKENTVNWNAPLVWAATFLTSTAPDLATR
ncbi:glycoside hydrolase family 9 protein [Streptomyces sp. NBC_01498]|uniref:glycoside hydrolase family 9 protein n=1 Tax=Streptomyces sp. NBC_01498 TaxID=2975870 RepID=UPI002E7BD5CD|nr:glycoside hydrolase family 9 protein [Streptomyces sp. NBC_01498]WTL23862.1 glycoside hydrolase family 9 protein [Streptomyces sp. NBC_01498]